MNVKYQKYAVRANYCGRNCTRKPKLRSCPRRGSSVGVVCSTVCIVQCAVRGMECALGTAPPRRPGPSLARGPAPQLHHLHPLHPPKQAIRRKINSGSRLSFSANFNILCLKLSVWTEENWVDDEKIILGFCRLFVLVKQYVSIIIHLCR